MHPGLAAVPARHPRARPVLVSLTPYAIAVVLCQGAWVAISVSFVLNVHRVRHLADRLADGDAVSRDQLVNAFHRQDVLHTATYIAAGIGIVGVMVWALAAQHNTNQLQPGSAGSGWAVLGWIVPIVNLFVPPRMLARIRSVQLNAFPRRGRPRAGYELIVAWWLLVLTSVAMEIVYTVEAWTLQFDDTLGQERRLLGVALIIGGVNLLAVLVLLGLVWMLTQSNERLRTEPPVDEPEEQVAMPIPLRPHIVSAYPSSIFPVAAHPSDPRWTPQQPPDPPPSGDRGYWS